MSDDASTDRTDLTGQVAVITGAGRGIGRALGTRLAAEGMKVGLLARTGSEVDSLRDEILASGGEAVSFTADVADRAAVEQVVAIDLSPGLVKTQANDNPNMPDSMWTPVERIADLVVRVAGGEFDDFAGRFLHATDDFDDVKAHLDEIIARDARVLRMVPGWDEDTKMKPSL